MSRPDYEKYGLQPASSEPDYKKYGLTPITHPGFGQHIKVGAAAIGGDISDLLKMATSPITSAMERATPAIFGQKISPKASFPTTESLENLMGVKQQDITGPLYATEKAAHLAPLIYGGASALYHAPQILKTGLSYIPGAPELGRKIAQTSKNLYSKISPKQVKNALNEHNAQSEAAMNIHNLQSETELNAHNEYLKNLPKTIGQDIGKGIPIEQTRKAGGDIIRGVGEKIEDKFKNAYASFTKNPEIADKQIFKRKNPPLEEYTIDPKTGLPLAKRPEIKPSFDKSESKYLNLSKDIIDQFANRDIKKLHKEFLKNPTVANAHFLKSDLRKEAATMRTITNADRAERSAYYDAANALEKDLHSGLRRINPVLENAYKNVTEAYKTEAVPILHNKKLKNILDKRNPELEPNLETLLRKPKADTLKLLAQAPELKNLTLHSELGKYATNSPQSMLKQTESLGKKGLSKFETPEFRNYQNTLRQGLERQDILKKSAEMKREELKKMADLKREELNKAYESSRKGKKIALTVGLGTGALSAFPELRHILPFIGGH